MQQQRQQHQYLLHRLLRYPRLMKQMLMMRLRRLQQKENPAGFTCIESPRTVVVQCFIAMLLSALSPPVEAPYSAGIKGGTTLDANVMNDFKRCQLVKASVKIAKRHKRVCVCSYFGISTESADWKCRPVVAADALDVAEAGQEELLEEVGRMTPPNNSKEALPPHSSREGSLSNPACPLTRSCSLTPRRRFSTGFSPLGDGWVRTWPTSRNDCYSMPALKNSGTP